VVQINSSPMEYWRETILDTLQTVLSPRGIYERSDSDNRGKEGLEKRTGWVRGVGDEAPIDIVEFGAVFGVDVVHGHKTGFYLDQAENRAFVREISANARVLNCFSYTGGFSVQAALGGSSEVVSVDSSQPALDLSAANFARNGMGDDDRFTHWNSDVFKALEALRADNRQFDLVILDPPKFASSGAHVERALHAYRKLARAGIPLVAPGGLLLTFSCSGAVMPEAFQKSITLALADNHRRGRIVRRLAAASDHVTDFGFGEGAYLKGLALEVA